MIAMEAIAALGLAINIIQFVDFMSLFRRSSQLRISSSLDCSCLNIFMRDVSHLELIIANAKDHIWLNLLLKFSNL